MRRKYEVEVDYSGLDRVVTAGDAREAARAVNRALRKRGYASRARKVTVVATDEVVPLELWS